MDLFGRGSIFLSSIWIIDRWQRSGGLAIERATAARWERGVSQEKTGCEWDLICPHGGMEVTPVFPLTCRLLILQKETDLVHIDEEKRQRLDNEERREVRVGARKVSVLII